MTQRERIKIGDGFGKWTVETEPYDVQQGRIKVTVVQCLCGGCGKQKEVPLSRLFSGMSNACRDCAHKDRRKVKAGDVFGSWVVEGEAYRDEALNKVMWTCRCGGCDQTFDVQTDNLLTGISTQCFYCARQAQRNGAESRNLVLSITWEFVKALLEKQDFKCALTRWPIQFASDCKGIKAGDTTASLDRIDSSQGYIESNVQLVHKDVNWMKNDFAQDEFIRICHAVAASHPLPSQT
jgi:hypothetical protein